METMAADVLLAPRPGEALRKWRLYFRAAQSELARAMRVSPSVLSDYESGRRPSPGLGFVRRYLEALASLGARPRAAARPAPEGILDLREFERPVKARLFAERIEGQVLAGSAHLDRDLHGYTLLDSVKAIVSLDARDYPRVYGRNPQRALLFSGVKFGRSPMVAIRVHPVKPGLIAYHRPRDVDKLAVRLAEHESIPFVVTRLPIATLEERLRALR